MDFPKSAFAFSALFCGQQLRQARPEGSIHCILQGHAAVCMGVAGFPNLWITFISLPCSDLTKTSEVGTSPAKGKARIR
jgi:hypothetical protein